VSDAYCVSPVATLRKLRGWGAAIFVIMPSDPIRRFHPPSVPVMAMQSPMDARQCNAIRVHVPLIGSCNAGCRYRLPVWPCKPRYRMQAHGYMPRITTPYIASASISPYISTTYELSVNNVFTSVGNWLYLWGIKAIVQGMHHQTIK